MNTSRVEALEVEIEHHTDEAFRLWMRLQDAKGIPYPSTREEAEQFFASCPVNVGDTVWPRQLKRLLTEGRVN